MDDDVSSRERSDVSAVETRALITSLTGSVIVGGTAIVWGILSGSNVVLFDGVYMVAGIALVVMSLVASRAARARPTGSYPFGRHAATPIAVVVQASAMIATLIYGVSDAIAVLIAGGSEASGLSVMLYGVVSALASVVLLFVLRKPARVSALVKAEVVTWRAGALQSAIVAVGGAIAVWLTSAGYATLAGLVDPLLVLIACAMIAPMAISLLREGGRELTPSPTPPPVCHPGRSAKRMPCGARSPRARTPSATRCGRPSSSPPTPASPRREPAWGAAGPC